MCGLAGIVRWGGLEAADPERAQAMADGMRHRGPDDQGLFRDARAVLAHRRLSILDLSEKGRQPMSTPDGRWTIVLNGEIYNHEALAAGLEGARATRTDTEVLLRLLARDGTACLGALRGMFAFALWDAREGTLLLARDPVGKKPLLYAGVPGGVLFASEAGRLLETGIPSREPDPGALDDFLQFSWVPEPRTLWKSVRKVPAGTWMRFGPSGVEARRYWQPRCGTALRALPPPERQARVSAALEEAVARRTVSDVPVGASLSGGIDSSLVACLLKGRLPGAFHTFSVAYDGADGLPIPDAAAAEAVSRALGTEHHAVGVGPEVLGRLRPLARNLGEPGGTVVLLLADALYAEASRWVKVVLGGDGADEVFGGYASYNAMRLAPALGRWLRPVPASCWRLGVRPELAEALPCYGEPPERIFPALYRAHAAGNRRRLGARWEGAPEPGTDLEALFREAAPGSYLEGLFALDLLYANRCSVAVDSDACGMAHGVEVRSPFLDMDVVEAAFALPLEDRVPSTRDPGLNKPVLRRLLRGRVPDWVLDRPKQGYGFALPVAAWLRGPWREEAARCFDSASGPLASLFDPARLRALWREHLDGEDRAGRLFDLLALSACLEEAAP